MSIKRLKPAGGCTANARAAVGPAAEQRKQCLCGGGRDARSLAADR